MLSKSEQFTFSPTTIVSSLSVNSMMSLSTSTSSTENVSGVVSVPEGCVMKQTSQFVPWDNPDNLVSQQIEVFINILFTGIFLPILFAISFSTNIVNMVVFYKHGLSERINMCLFTLALVDCLFVSVAYGYSCDVLYMFAQGRGVEISPAAKFFLETHLVGLHGLALSSQTLSAVIALERCVCVTWPLLVKNLMSTKKTAVVLWILVLVIFASIFVFAGLRYGIICMFDPTDKSTMLVIYPSDIYLRNKDVFDFMYGIVGGLILPGFCITSVTVCTAITVTKLKKLSRWRETVSSASLTLSSRDLAVTRMIIGTSVLFIVTFLPSFVISTSFLVVPDLALGKRYHNLYLVFVSFFQLGSIINSSFNFFLYYVYGSQFRETVRHVFSCCVCVRRRQQNIK